MKQILTTALLLMFTFISNLSANTLTFNGNGNWNDPTKWSPNKPTSYPSYNIYNQDTVIINGNCTINELDSISIAQDITYIINGSLTNNSNYNFLMGTIIIDINGTFTNNNNFTLIFTYLGTDGHPINRFINYGNVINNGFMDLQTINNTIYNWGVISNTSTLNILGNIININIIDNQGTIETIGGYYFFGRDTTEDVPLLVNADIINEGLITNSGNISSESKIENHSKIVANGGDFSSYGRQFFNYDTIVGKLHTGYLINLGVLSPGFSEFDTDTMFFHNYGLSNQNIINIDINSATDYDVIQLDYGNNLSQLAGIVITFNPNFIPSITDTFTLVYALNAGPNPLKLSRNNMALPIPPIGYIWKVMYEPLAVKLALEISSALPYENLTFKAFQKANSVELNWNVTSIENVATFEIERADENNQFVTIGKVDGSDKLDYSFIDSKPNIGIIQYRLKSIDLNGKSQYSKVVTIDFTKLSKEIINTLVENTLFMNIEEETELNVINSNGERVFSFKVNKGDTSISLSQLTAGIYFIKTDNSTYKIVKL